MFLFYCKFWIFLIISKSHEEKITFSKCNLNDASAFIAYSASTKLKARLCHQKEDDFQLHAGTWSPWFGVLRGTLWKGRWDSGYSLPHYQSTFRWKWLAQASAQNHTYGYLDHYRYLSPTSVFIPLRCNHWSSYHTFLLGPSAICGVHTVSKDILSKMVFGCI